MYTIFFLSEWLYKNGFIFSLSGGLVLREKSIKFLLWQQIFLIKLIVSSHFIKSYSLNLKYLATSFLSSSSINFKILTEPPKSSMPTISHTEGYIFWVVPIKSIISGLLDFLTAFANFFLNLSSSSWSRYLLTFLFFPKYPFIPLSWHQLLKSK